MSPHSTTKIAKKYENSALIFGCGYLGKRVAARLIGQSWNVYAITRSRQKAELLASEGITPLVADWLKPYALRDLPPASRVLVSVGWDRSGRSQYDVYVHGLRNALRSTFAESQLVYVSSSGVFHQCDGSWVDETSPCKPKPGSGGWSHLRGEELLRRLRPRSPWTVLRMAGLYGPDRVPRSAEIRSGKPVAAPTEGFLNLIHIEDAASVVLSAWETATRPRTYVVSDGTPVVRRTYYDQIANTLGMPLPEFAPTSAASRRRTVTNKRVWTARMRRDLCPTLEYRSYVEGLRSILKEKSRR